MSAATSSPFLRRALLLDAVATGATALLLLSGAGPLADLFALPASLLRYAGAILLPFVAVVAWAATRSELVPPVIRAIVLCNALWVVGSIALLAGPWVAPTALGHAFVIAQALVVGLFAELQVIGLRRAEAVRA